MNGEWFKSSRSTGTKACVEVAFLDDGMVGVRDSKHLGGPELMYTSAEWDAFIGGVKDGEFDRPGSLVGVLGRWFGVRRLARALHVESGYTPSRRLRTSRL